MKILPSILFKNFKNLNYLELPLISKKVQKKNFYLKKPSLSFKKKSENICLWYPSIYQASNSLKHFEYLEQQSSLSPSKNILKLGLKASPLKLPLLELPLEEQLIFKNKSLRNLNVLLNFNKESKSLEENRKFLNELLVLRKCTSNKKKFFSVLEDKERLNENNWKNEEKIKTKELIEKKNFSQILNNTQPPQTLENLGGKGFNQKNQFLLNFKKNRLLEYKEDQLSFLDITNGFTIKKLGCLLLKSGGKDKVLKIIQETLIYLKHYLKKLKNLYYKKLISLYTKRILDLSLKRLHRVYLLKLKSILSNNHFSGLKSFSSKSSTNSKTKSIKKNFTFQQLQNLHLKKIQILGYSKLRKRIQRKFKFSIFQIINQTYSLVTPGIEVKKARRSGRTVFFPAPMRPKRQISFATKWIIEGALLKFQRSMKFEKKIISFQQALSLQILESYFKKGYPSMKKNELHRLAEKNRANLHLSW